MEHLNDQVNLHHESITDLRSRLNSMKDALQRDTKASEEGREGAQEAMRRDKAAIKEIEDELSLVKSQHRSALQVQSRHRNALHHANQLKSRLGE